MSRKPNDVIGEVTCPVRECAEKCNVYRFRARSEAGERNRFAGKVYCHCPRHGRFGGDGNAEMQDYILNTKGAIWTEDEKKAASAPVPPVKSAPARAAPPVPAPAPSPVPKPARSPWKPLID